MTDNEKRTHFTYANITATLGLVLALGVGTSYAAAQLPRNSVGAKQIKTNAVKSAEIKDGAITGGDINGTTLAGLKTPRAYGVFRSNGTLVTARSKGVTVFLLPSSVGEYCVTPTAASGIDPTKSTIIATPDYNDGVGSFNIVQTIVATDSGQASACPAGYYVVTDNFDGSGFTREDNAVSFVIP